MKRDKSKCFPLMSHIRLELEKVTHAIAFINAFDFERGWGVPNAPEWYRLYTIVYDCIRSLIRYAGITAVTLYDWEKKSLRFLIPKKQKKSRSLMRHILCNTLCNTLRNTLCNIPCNTLRKILRNMLPNKLPNKLPKILPNKLPKILPNKLPNKLPKILPNKLPKIFL